MQAMTEPMTIEPCPFCGKDGPFDEWLCEWLDGKGGNVVRCPNCHGAAPMATWNRRAHIPQLAQAVDVDDDTLLDIARRVGLRQNLHGVNATDAKFLLRTFVRALSGEKAGPVDGEVLVAIDRGEGYEDVHPDLVAEDCMGNATERGWRWRVVSASPAPDKEGE
jgi:hypothetical protein